MAPTQYDHTLLQCTKYERQHKHGQYNTSQSMFMVNQLIVVKVEYVAYWALLFGQVARCTRYNYMGFNSAVLVCWYVDGFSLRTPVSFTNKSDKYDIPEILMKKKHP